MLFVGLNGNKHELSPHKWTYKPLLYVCHHIIMLLTSIYKYGKVDREEETAFRSEEWIEELLKGKCSE